MFEAREVAGSATYKQSETVLDLFVLNDDPSLSITIWWVRVVLPGGKCHFLCMLNGASGASEGGS